VSQLFSALKPQIKALYDVVRGAHPVSEAVFSTPIPVETQRLINADLLKLIGLDPHHSRCDISTHPFTIAIGMEDVRITTRMDASNLPMMLYGTIHEAGHAFYEMGLPASQYGLPGGNYCSLSIHESQSRIWENNVGRSRPFVTALLPILKRHAPATFSQVDADALYCALNAVKTSLVRTTADELTYHLHILLRFEIERDVVNGEANVADIPRLWREKMREYLGLEVPNDTMGELQDIHWSIGAIGYFPTYSLGSFYAAQFFHYAQMAIPGLEGQIQEGNFAPFKQWLADNIWSQGRLYDSSELCERVTGKPLDVAYFLRYLQAKLSHVYSLALNV
jgi:carboxypeptidase Taq